MTVPPKETSSQLELEYPTYPVLAILDAAVAKINLCDPIDIIARVGVDVAGYLGSMLETDQPETIDPCFNADLPQGSAPLIAAMCLQRSIDLNTSANAFSLSSTSARTSFNTSRDAWQAARSKYLFLVANAELTAASAVASELNIYTDSANHDSASRDQKLYFTMQKSAATVVQSYQATVQSAGDALATEVTALLSAYVTFIAALNFAQTAKMIDDATAQRTFWAAVEGVLEAN